MSNIGMLGWFGGKQGTFTRKIFSSRGEYLCRQAIDNMGISRRRDTVLI